MIELDFWMLPLFFLGIGALYLLARKKVEQSKLAFSSLHLFNSSIQGKALHYAQVPQCLYLLTALLFLFASLDSRLLSSPKDHLPSQSPDLINGVAVYIAIDQSGSMDEKIIDDKGERVRKIDLLKEVVGEFIKNRPYDLLGLLSFARTPTVIAPMTTDHDFLMRELSKIDVITKAEQNATGIGYAIRKIVRLIEATRYFEKDKKKTQAAKAAIILATDGLQTTYPDDKDNPNRTIRIESAAEEAAKAGIKLYIVSINPKLASAALSPHRRMMEQSAKLTGGNLYIVQSIDELQSIYKEISQIEPSTKMNPEKSVKKSSLLRSFSLYPYLIFLALTLLFIAFSLEQTLARRIPS